MESAAPVSAGSVIGIEPNVGFPLHTGSLSCGRLLLSPLYSTILPGQGNRMSTFSLVMQPSILATNIGGKEGDCFGMSSDAFEGESLATVMGAQFMHISRLPIRLNHVQAKVYFPGAMNALQDREVELERMVRRGMTRKNAGYTCGASSFVGLDDFPFRSLCRLAITGKAHLARPSTMCAAAQKLDDIVLPSPISGLFCRGLKGTWL